MDAQETLIQVLTGLNPDDRTDAKTFQFAVIRDLIAMGCKVRREVSAPFHTPKGLRNGRIDFVVDSPFQAAVELDNWTPRDKSIRKLATFDCLRFIALRNSPDVLVQV